jgi:hypothetical protein
MPTDVGPTSEQPCPRKGVAVAKTAARRGRFAALSAAVGVILMLLLASTPADARGVSARNAHKKAAPTPVTITVLSSRADLVVGDEALLEVAVPTGQDPHEVTVQVGTEDETSAFSVESGNTLLGLVTGLHNGANTVTAQLAHGPGAQIILTDHPLGGPLFAGPQVKQWTCEAGATDSQCDKAPTYAYLYRSTNPEKTHLEPYNPEEPPSDVATTTANGVTVPFIVRVETGYEDRDQYSIAVLYNPEEPWSATSPQPQFAHKMLITHGFGCGVSYESGIAPSTTEAGGLNIVPGAFWALSNGWTVMSTALDNNDHNCDVVTSAESLVMAKERVIDRYGTLRYTIGTGCSGGSLTQQWVANAYPGIYQGILPTCSFPDTWTSATQVFDYHMLNHYFADKEEWGSGIEWTTEQEAAVEGTPETQNSTLSDAAFFSAIEPGFACPGTTEENRYNPTSNPGGVRCSIADYAINVFGARVEAEWGPQEKAIDRGFAGIPIGNVGVQYGLSALREHKITPAQFVDLNAKIGGLDEETLKPTPPRLTANRVALGNAYRSGMINETNNLGQVAIIDCLGPNPEEAHDSYRTFAVQARLKRENGTSANQLIWEGPYPLLGSPTCQTQALMAMDGWMAQVAADTKAIPLSKKIIKDRPKELRDRCYTFSGEVKDPSHLCKKGTVPVYGTPRTVAGEAITTDDNECQLQPLSKKSNPTKFTAEQSAALQSVFPNGVCNYKPSGVEQQPTIPWLTYQTSSGELVTGGEPMGPEPVSTPIE